MRIASAVEKLVQTVAGLLSSGDTDDNQPEINRPVGLCPKTGDPFSQHARRCICSECGEKLTEHAIDNGTESESNNLPATHEDKLPVLLAETDELPILKGDLNDTPDNPIESDIRAGDLLNRLR